MPAGTPVEGGECIRFGDNQLDLSARTLLQNNAPVVITSGEFSLLAFIECPTLNLLCAPSPSPPLAGTSDRTRPRSRQRHRQPQHGRSGVAGAQAGGTGSNPPPLRADGLGLATCLHPHAEIADMPRQRGLHEDWLAGAWGTALLDAGGAVRQLERFRRCSWDTCIRLSELTLERYAPDQRAHGPGAPGELTTSGARSRDPGFGPAAQRQELRQTALASRTAVNPPPRAGRARRRCGLNCSLLWSRSGCAPPAQPHALAATTHTAAAGPGGRDGDDRRALSSSMLPVLRKLDAVVGSEKTSTEPAPKQGSAEVRRISRRFNAMVRRLAEKERATMLAGIAHDLRHHAAVSFVDAGAQMSEERTRCQSDLEALERITGQPSDLRRRR